MRVVCSAVIGWCALASATCAQQPADQNKAIEAALAELSTKLAADPARDELRQFLGRSLREQISEANRRSSAEWSRIASREAWDAFRAEKLKALRESLKLPHKTTSSVDSSAGASHSRPPELLVTGTIKGDGFRIHNLVYQSRPGLVVTANLYVPDPPRSPMPGILISHSHHNPKHEGELQDMGMTWARAGCYVLVPDHLGHGERRQHPFATAVDFDGPFQVGRQDYYFRYDTSLQLYLVGESLMGWMVHDLMTGVDVLLAQPGIDASRIILLGSVAGGGDPTAVTAALDERIACLVPFNFGGPQPENRYPLQGDAETSFNYAGGGSWESTRNLRNSARDGFLPSVIVGSIAPRKLIHAHEFSWDRDHDPVWKRYEKIWGFYDAHDSLAFTTGFGTIQNTSAPASHCNNIGPPHRKLIHDAFRKWFAIDVKPEDEYSKRRSREELTCLTDEARKHFQPKMLHEILAAMADQQLAQVRAAQAQLAPDERRKQARDTWARLLGDTQPPKEIKVRVGSRVVETIGPLTVTRELLETEPGIAVPILTLYRTAQRGKPWPVVLGVASDGVAPSLQRRRDDIAEGLRSGFAIVLVEVRGTGRGNPDNDHGQQSAATAHAATALMLGQPMLGAQLRDLRAAWQHVKQSPDLNCNGAWVMGGSGGTPLAVDAPFSFPRRIDKRPSECEPTGALLAALMGLLEDDFDLVFSRRGLVSYRSVLDSPFVQVPLESVVPGVLRAEDVPDIVSLLQQKRDIDQNEPVDGRGRLVSATNTSKP